MPSIKLTAEETKTRFGVAKAIGSFPSSLTKEEEANVKTVLQYMEVCGIPSFLTHLALPRRALDC